MLCTCRSKRKIGGQSPGVLWWVHDDWYRLLTLMIHTHRNTCRGKSEEGFFHLHFFCFCDIFESLKIAVSNSKSNLRAESTIHKLDWPNPPTGNKWTRPDHTYTSSSPGHQGVSGWTGQQPWTETWTRLNLRHPPYHWASHSHCGLCWGPWCLEGDISILIKHESCLCVSVRVFRSHQKSKGHEILALGLIWTNLKHDEARFSKFWFLRGGPHMVQC